MTRPASIAIGVFSVCLTMILPLTSLFAQDTELEQQLQAQQQQSAQNLSPQHQSVMRHAADKLLRENIFEKCLFVGDTMPSFALKNTQGEEITSKSLLDKGYLAIVFYRGGWCPYCNIHLRALNKAYPQIKSLGAELVAISPQKVEKGLQTTEQNSLQFPLLYDEDNEVAEKFGVVFTLPQPLVEVYNDLGIDLREYNETRKPELPIPAVYIVAPDGKIEFSYVEPDYRKRLDPQEIVSFLEELREEELRIEQEREMQQADQQ